MDWAFPSSHWQFAFSDSYLLNLQFSHPFNPVRPQSTILTPPPSYFLTHPYSPPRTRPLPAPDHSIEQLSSYLAQSKIILIEGRHQTESNDQLNLNFMACGSEVTFSWYLHLCHLHVIIESLFQGRFHPHHHHEPTLMCAIGVEQGYRVTIKSLSNLFLTHAFNWNAPKSPNPHNSIRTTPRGLGSKICWIFKTKLCLILESE